MPLTAKGNKIMDKMRSEYGAKKGTSVFYASRNKGKITNVDPESSHHEKHKKIIHARRAMEDTLREQEDALLGNDPEEEKRDKLKNKGK